MEKGKEGGRGWRRGGERAQEGKGWENHAVNRGGPGEASRLRCGTCKFDFRPDTIELKPLQSKIDLVAPSASIPLLLELVDSHFYSCTFFCTFTLVFGSDFPC